MRTTLGNKAIFKSAALRKGAPLRQFNVVSYKRPGMSLSLENTTTLFPEEGGREESRRATRYLEKYSPSTQEFCPRLYQKTVPVAVNITESA